MGRAELSHAFLLIVIAMRFCFCVCAEATAREGERRPDAYGYGGPFGRVLFIITRVKGFEVVLKRLLLAPRCPAKRGQRVAT